MSRVQRRTAPRNWTFDGPLRAVAIDLLHHIDAARATDEGPWQVRSLLQPFPAALMLAPDD
jgi:hypothetical protein